jgi:hypothetical protein
VLLLGAAGLFTPLFDLSSIHGFSAKVFAQHFYLDGCAGLGGYYAASFCQHRWHRIIVMVAIDLISTALLVSVVG